MSKLTPVSQQGPGVDDGARAAEAGKRALASLPKSANSLIGSVEVEACRIIGAAVPDPVLLVFGMLLVAHGPYELEVAGQAANVLWRTCILATQAHGPVVGFGCRHQALYADGMRPAIAEVVFIDELVYRRTQHLADGELTSVPEVFFTPVIGRVQHAVTKVADPELVQVAVRPSHAPLDYAMQLRQSERVGHPDEPPYCRLDLAQLDVQFVDACR